MPKVTWQVRAECTSSPTALPNFPGRVLRKLLSASRRLPRTGLKPQEPCSLAHCRFLELPAAERLFDLLGGSLWSRLRARRPLLTPPASHPLPHPHSSVCLSTSFPLVYLIIYLPFYLLAHLFVYCLIHLASKHRARGGC